MVIADQPSGCCNVHTFGIHAVPPLPCKPQRTSNLPPNSFKQQPTSYDGSRTPEVASQPKYTLHKNTKKKEPPTPICLHEPIGGAPDTSARLPHQKSLPTARERRSYPDRSTSEERCNKYHINDNQLGNGRIRLPRYGRMLDLCGF